jgi:hypothetical protein
MQDFIPFKHQGSWAAPKHPPILKFLPPTQISPDNIKWLEKLMGVKDKYI